MRFVYLTLLLSFLPQLASSSYFSIATNYPPYTFFRHPVNDLKAKSMGNTEILSTSGSNSLFTNPALLSKNEEDWISITWMVQSGSDEIQNGNNVINNHLTFFDYTSDYYQPSLFKNFTISRSKKIYEKSAITLGFGYQVAHDMNVNRITNYSWFWDEQNHESEYDIDVDADLNTYAPAISFNLEDIICIGVSSEFTFFDTYSELIKRRGQTTTIGGEVVREEWSNEDYDGDFKGSTFTYGIIFDYKILKAGYKFRNKLEYSFEETQLHFISNNRDEFYIESGRSMDIPQSEGYSVAINFLDNLTVIGEYQIRKYSELKQRSYYDIDYDYEDGDIKRLGFEYRHSEFLAIRGGVFSEAAFLFDNNQGKPNELNGFTFGIGLRYKYVVLDIGSEYYTFEYLFNTAEDIPDSTPAEIEGSHFNLGITLSIVH